MSGGIFHISDDGHLVKLTERQYDSEDILQVLLADYPDLLGSDQIGAGDRRWILVEREVSVPDEDGDTSLSLDHLFLDQDGIPTLVEVKRSSDTRIRREVVGQMLDYASNAVARWSIDFLQQRFEARVKAPDEELSKALGVTDTAKFWQQVKTNLQAGRIRMLFVADVIPGMLRRIVEFLNEQMEPAEVLAVEVQQYVSQDKNAPKTLVPRVFGQLQKKKVAERRVISEEEFESGIRAKGDGFWETVVDFRKQCEAVGGMLKPYSTGMGAYFPLGQGRSAVMAYLDTRDAGILWPLQIERLEEYADQRSDLDHFTHEALAEYKRRIAEFPASFRAPSGERDKVSMAAGNVDVATFKRFLDMIVAFYHSQILPRRS